MMFHDLLTQFSLVDIIQHMDTQEDIIFKFVIKRAFRLGSVSSQDLVIAFGFNALKATRSLSEAVKVCSDMLERRGKAVCPKLGVQAPEYASEETLLTDLDCGIADPVKTGFFPKEVPVEYISWTDSTPPEKGILSKIIKGIHKGSLLKIVYIGMKKGEVPKERRVIPLALEQMNDQWRLIAQEIRTTLTKERKKEHKASLRTFVLSRILKAEWDLGRKPKGFVQVGHWDDIVEIPVSLNASLSKQQGEVISRELKIRDGNVRIPSRSRFEFERRFMDSPVNPEAVWPPLKKR